MHKTRNLGDTIYFWFAANDTSGSGADGETPLCDVRLAGAAVDAAPVLSPTPTLLTHANYGAGLHEVAIAATAENGFAAGNEYGVFCTLLVDSQNPAGFLGSFYLTAAAQAPVTVADIQSGLATAADQTTILNRIGAFTGSGFNTVLGFLRALMRSDADTPSDVGGTFDGATDSLQAIRDRGDTAWGSGSGSNTVTLTFLDTNGDAVADTKITIEGAGVSGTTSSSGVVVFYLDDGTYTFINPSTASHTGEENEVEVSGDTEATITITANSVPTPSDPDYCRVFVYAKEPDGSVPTSGTFSLERIHSPSTTGTGATTVTIVLGDDTLALDSNGYAYIDILQGAKVDLALYTNSRGVPLMKRNVTVPATSTANWETLT